MSRIFDQLVNIVTQLRHPSLGCPWDSKQTFESIAAHTLEEAYEVVDAIKQNNADDIIEELGDLLFQIVFLCSIAQDSRLFGIEDVIKRISDKMISRHPHVFDQKETLTYDVQIDAWEKKKEKERDLKANKVNTKGALSIFEGIALALPALSRSFKLQGRAMSNGFGQGDIISNIKII